ncbi:hypothetical protein U9M48_017891 [Paspalum notatum var. saurae]|uniref:Uncharacterized protein n=1 Tax=Paspalum notatum var. saurae TaxID=547442 RepID=A0AAQ3TBA5_PASNO
MILSSWSELQFLMFAGSPMHVQPAPLARMLRILQCKKDSFPQTWQEAVRMERNATKPSRQDHPDQLSSEWLANALDDSSTIAGWGSQIN